MLMRPAISPPDLDTERRRVDRAASSAAVSADRRVLRLAGRILLHSADVNGADYEAERLNVCLRAAGRSDFVATATDRLCTAIDGRLVEAAAAALAGARRG